VASWPDLLQKLIPVALAAALAAGIVAFVVEQRDEPDPLEVRSGDPAKIEVYITGAVAQPGVYEMTEDDRVVDLLTMAGGFTEDANPEAAHLAKKLHDEDTIVVPRLSQGGNSSQVAGSTGSVVNLNSASQEELIALPGIGEAYSRRIIDSRTNDGPFSTTDELLARALIPASTYEEIKALITAP
jgi:competence protein ComEA